MGKRYYYNPDELIDLVEATAEAYESLDTRRGLKFRMRKDGLAKKKRLRNLTERNMPEDKWYKKNSAAAYGKKEELSRTNKKVRLTKVGDYDDICYNGGLYKKVTAGWID